MGAVWLERTACGLLSTPLGPVVCRQVGLLFLFCLSKKTI